MKGIYLLSIATVLVSGQDVATKFKEDEVAGAPGGVLTEAPKLLLSVEYEEQEVSAELGNILPVSKTQSQPKVAFSEANTKNKYTLGEPHRVVGREKRIWGDILAILGGFRGNFFFLTSLDLYKNNDNFYIQQWWTLMLPAETIPRQLSGSTGWSSTFLVRGEKFLLEISNQLCT